MPLFTNLSSLVVDGFHAAPAVAQGWIPVTFQTAEFEGTGLATAFASSAEPLTLDLKLQGEHTLYLALGPSTALQVWLEGADGYTEMVTQHGGIHFQECRWTATNITGKRICIAPKKGARPQAAFIGYIRAEKTVGQQQSARNLVGTNDGWSWVALDGIDTERDVWKFFEPMRQSDFGLMLWGIGGADFTACHNTKVGTVAPFETAHAFRECDKVHAQQIEKFLTGGGDILKTAVQAARDTGVAIHFYIRPEAFFAPFPHDHTFTSRFMADNPQWRCRDEHGDEIMRLSYAYPEVQNHMLAVFEELLDYAPDGLNLAFNRSLPMMICEEPVLQEFEKQHGRRPNLPEEIDSKEMAAARTAIMTGFIERVHELLQSRNMQFSCMVQASEEELRMNGVDLPAWCRRGILDSVMIHSGGFHAHSTPITENAFWKELRDAGTTRIYPNGWGGSYDHTEAARFLKETVFDTGFAGGFFWDTENLSENPYNWEAVRRGGSMDHLQGVLQGSTQPPRLIPMTWVQGVKLTRYNPGTSY